ncbi:hypothetical protein PIIN_07568 [Serendipita indica DSM 11827]|uniref:Uncharacterized protein n=1 Tax=Serendipita indica (strain DSM 11827) TaxID=1109443 RepID=G4TQM2_SERID|nr:hypothetical protein PIIN_07568 [Serendipita indica DSM 11827]
MNLPKDGESRSYQLGASGGGMAASTTPSRSSKYKEVQVASDSRPASADAIEVVLRSSAHQLPARPPEQEVRAAGYGKMEESPAKKPRFD